MAAAVEFQVLWVQVQIGFALVERSLSAAFRLEVVVVIILHQF